MMKQLALVALVAVAAILAVVAAFDFGRRQGIVVGEERVHKQLDGKIASYEKRISDQSRCVAVARLRALRAVDHDTSDDQAFYRIGYLFGSVEHCNANAHFGFVPQIDFAAALSGGAQRSDVVPSPDFLRDMCSQMTDPDARSGYLKGIKQ
jgi:hypothetical protein